MIVYLRIKIGRIIRTVNYFMNYIDVCKIFEERGCKLLDIEADINTKKNLTKQKTLHHVRVNFIASCGHINTVAICNFKLRGTGILCIECMRQKTGLSLKKKGKFANTIENDGYIFLKKILEEQFDIKKTPEGCEADMLIRPIIYKDDLWLKIQLKTTSEQIHNMYSFSVVPYKYGNDIVYTCICEKDNKIWCVERQDIANLKCKFNVSKKSKYDKFECTYDSLKQKLSELYQTYLEFNLLCTLQKGLLPKNIYQQREQEYIKLRESLLPEWKFEYNSVEGLPYDFTVYNKRVQEKVSNSKRTESIYNICLQRSSMHNGFNKRTMVPYQQHHFDILWVHLQNKGIFYVIPMEELIKYKYIKTDIDKGKRSLTINISDQYAWYSKYQFKNDAINIDSLLEIFQKE